MAGPQNPQDAGVILVVEDEPDIALVLRLMLEQGHIVTCVGDLAQAREAYRRGLPFDLVMLDVLLPDGNGLDFCRELKAAHPALPVMVLTAYTHEEVRALASQAGADRFVEKPFDPDGLCGTVEDVLGGRRARA
jgi:DNA-binding response OmpR family regulator